LLQDAMNANRLHDFRDAAENHGEAIELSY